MGTKVELTGQRFGRWTVIGPAPRASGGQLAWYCACDCGTSGVAVLGQNLRNERSQSCGCWARERATTHGMTGTPTWSSWRAMIERCTSPAHHNFASYGGRGIAVCDRWQTFENFVADMGIRPPGMTLERTENNGPYEKANCRWATPLEQGSNKRNNRYIEFDGERLTYAQWAKRLGLNRSIVRRRLEKGWPIERVLAADRWHSSGKPLAETASPTYTHGGETLTLLEWAKRTGIRAGLLAYRIKAGWPLDAVFAPKGGHYHKVRRV